MLGGAGGAASADDGAQAGGQPASGEVKGVMVKSRPQGWQRTVGRGVRKNPRPPFSMWVGSAHIDIYG
jgi:hypothetical protein